MVNEKTDEVIEKPFELLLKRYQIGLETSMRGSDFIFDFIHLLHYKCHKVNFKRGGSYIDSPDWMKNKRETVNPINKKDNKCFQYTTTVALNHEELGKHPERITKNKPFIDKYNWEGINYASEKNDWKTFEKNNLFLLMFYMLKKKKYILPMFQNII